MAFPSMIVATGWTLALPLGERRVLGHELALRAIRREPHDDHPARLGTGHDALAERGMDDVVAQPERAASRGGLLAHRGPRRRRARAHPAPAAARARARAERALAVDELRRDLGQEAARQPERGGPE